MNSKIYRQADSRWGKLKYPSGGYTVAGSGCGLCACVHNIIEIPKYANYTPIDVRPYMVGQGFATKGHGTTWNGITKTLQHYGFGVATPNISSSMSGAWAYLNKSGAPKQGVLLFKAGTRGGVRWTSGGHYVAFLNYKVQNGKHYFYTKDSGGRHHDGWYCYETTMRGLLPKIWIVTSKPDVPTVAKPTGKYSGTIPSATLKKGSKGDSTKNWQRFLNWYHPDWKLAVDGDFGAKTEADTMSFQKTEGIYVDGIAGKNTYGKAKAYLQVQPQQVSTPTTKAQKAVACGKEIIKGGKYKYKKWNNKDKKTKQCPICHKLTGKYKGWNCIGFVSACFHHGAGLPITCSCSGIGTDSFFTKVTEASWKKRNGSGWKMITNGGSKGGADISTSKLIAGDVLICYDGNGKFKHIAIYSGNGKIIESTKTRTPNVGERTYKDLCGRHHVTRAFRYVG